MAVITKPSRRAKIRKAPVQRLDLAARAKSARPPTDERGTAGTVGWGGVMSSLVADHAPAWQPPRRWTTIETMRADPAVTAALAALTYPLLGASFTVEAASDDAEDARLAEFIDAGLSNMTTDLMTHRMESLDSVGDGVSVFYTRYEQREDGLYHLRKLKLLPNKAIQQWHVEEEYGGPDGVSQVLPTGREERFYMDDLLVFTHMRRGDSLLGRPALRAMYRPWFLIDKLSRISAIAVERGASGTPWARYTGGSDTEAAKLDRALQGLHANERAFFRVDEDVPDWGIKGIEGATVDAVPLMEFQRRDLFLAPLAQFLALGTDGIGSMALSGDHSSFFLQALEFIARELEDTYNRYLIPRWIGYNWSVTADRLPRVKLGALDRRDVGAWTQSVAAMVAAGVPLPMDALAEEAARMLGITVPEPMAVPAAGEMEGVDDVNDPNAEEADDGTGSGLSMWPGVALHADHPGNAHGRGGGGAKGRGPIPGADSSSRGDSMIPAAAVAGGRPDPAAAKVDKYVWDDGDVVWEIADDEPAAVALAARPLKSQIMLEALGVPVDFAGMMSALDEAEAKIIRDLAPLQAKQRNRIVRAAKAIIAKGDAAAVESFAIEGDEEAAAILAALVALYDKGGAAALSEIEAQGPKPSPIAKAAKIAAGVYLGAVALEAARSLVDRMRTAWGGAVLDQMRTGYDAAALDEAVTAPGERLLADVARRGSSTAMGMGRGDAVGANADKVSRVILTAVLDEHTCPYCLAVDGAEFPVDKAPSVPLAECEGRSRCRCQLIPVVAGRTDMSAVPPFPVCENCGELITFAGKPCGASWIAPGKTCLAGGGAVVRVGKGGGGELRCAASATRADRGAV